MKPWRILLAGLLAGAWTGCVRGAWSSEAKPSRAAEKREAAETFMGVVRTGIMAIGGETTGVLLETASGDYELDAGGNRELAAAIERLDGKRAIVSGEYRPRPGVEIKERRIIVVRAIRPAE